MDPFPQSPGDTSVDVAIVDDDRVLQAMLKVVLQDQHIHAEVCPLGWEAHRCIRRTHPKLVILDVEMPKVDGIQLFYLLRTDPKTREIPVLFLTVYPQRVEKELPNYEEMQATLMQKPFESEHLLKMVTTALRPHPRF